MYMKNFFSDVFDLQNILWKYITPSISSFSCEVLNNFIFFLDKKTAEGFLRITRAENK